MKVDKKNANKSIRMVMLKEIGHSIHHPVAIAEDLLLQVLLPSIEIVPGGKSLNGVMTVPGSKSLSNRTLALAEGDCLVKGLLHADDTHVMLDALDQLKVYFEWRYHGETLLVRGSGGKLSVPREPLYLGNAGTSSRFVTSMCTLMSPSELIYNTILSKAVLTGSDRLKERPIKDLVDALTANGCKINYLNKDGYFPFEVEGTGLMGGIIPISGEISSQFISSLLISAPYAKQPVTLKLIGKTVSQPFIDMTTKLMAQFGIVATYNKEENAYMIPQGIYKNPEVLQIESDASSASYPLAVAAITGGTVIVPSITSTSLQGDAMFATRVLTAMGCIVTQNENETIVQGAMDGLKAIPEIDMSEMTDTFMTAAVLAAVASGTTRIVNIANQRVKECNRIEAMVTEFKKLGIVARELPDGLEIDGLAGDFSKLNPRSFIECYKDHRIAMSFAVLGCVVPGIVILDKDCTDKTFPEFWISMQRNFGVTYSTPQHSQEGASTQGLFLPRVNTFTKDTSVVIIGMRGTGKTTIGSLLATKLNRSFIDMDAHFVASHNGKSIQDFVSETSWDAFRVEEVKQLREVLLLHPKDVIIATGGGIVETEAGKTLIKELAQQHLIVQLSAPITDVIKWLEKGQRADLGEEVNAIWSRRRPLYQALSHYEFHVPSSTDDWARAATQFQQLIARVLSNQKSCPSLPVLPTPQTIPSYFVCLTHLDYTTITVAEMKSLLEGVDAVEMRADLLSSVSIDNIRTQYAVLRELLFLAGAEDFPIIFTIRSKEQGGQFSGTEEEFLELIGLGLRFGAHFVDFEAQLPSTLLNYKGVSSVISSFHDWKSVPSHDLVRAHFDRCFDVTQADIIKVVMLAHDDIENVATLRSVMANLRHAALKGNTKYQKPIIGLLAGVHGKLSRVLNEVFTPTCHPSLPTKAAPGQLSVQEIQSIRSTLLKQ